MTRFLLILISAVALCGCSSGPHWKRQGFAFSVPADPPATNATTNMTALSRVSISPLFQSRSFTYRIGEHSYEQDPYAGFLVPPERALAESIRGWLRASGMYGRVIEPGSQLRPGLVLEVSITELYGDFRTPSQPTATMGIHLTCYEIQDGAPRRIILDKFISHTTSLERKTPGALMAAWDTDLREIMNEINSDYAKAISGDH